MAKAKELRILLVQAGGTDWDREGRLAGAADLPLSAAERERLLGESALMGGEVGGVRPGVMLCGPDEASRETAALVGNALGGVKVRALPGLADVDLGLWEGVAGEELVGRCPRSYRQWVEDPGSVTAPQGESLSAAEERVLGEIARAADKSREERPVLGVVLRPLAYAVVRCWAEGLPTSRVRNVLGEGPNEPRVLTVERARFDGAKATG